MRTWTWLRDSGIRNFAHRMVERYYLEPVASLEEIWTGETRPATGRPIEIAIRVHNYGGMTARNIGLKLIVREVATGIVKEVDSQLIESIGVGYSTYRDKFEDPQGYRMIDVDGQFRPVFDYNNIIYRDRTVRKLCWTPEKKGHYVLSMVAESERGMMVLNPLAELYLRVENS